MDKVQGDETQNGTVEERVTVRDSNGRSAG